MKKSGLFILFFCAYFPLFAQNAVNNSAIFIHVAEPDGNGKEPEDNAFFREAIADILIEKNYSVTGRPPQADYLVKGSIAPWEAERNPGAGESPGTRFYALRLALSDNGTGKELAEQTLLYSGAEDSLALVSFAVANMLADTPAGLGTSYVWRNSLWYFGGAVFWTPRVYYGDSPSANTANIGAGVSAELHFINWLSIEAGLEAAPDWIAASGESGDNYWDVILSVPLTLKFVFKPGSYFMIEPYAGINFNIPLYGDTNPPLLSWRAGLQYGIKAGNGVFFLEPRFSMDFGASTLNTRSGESLEYRRHMIYIGAGYKYGVKRRPW